MPGAAACRRPCRRHRRHPLPSSNYGDEQTNWIKFIQFVCPSQVHASLPTPPTPQLLVVTGWNYGRSVVHSTVHSKSIAVRDFI